MEIANKIPKQSKYRNKKVTTWLKEKFDSKKEFKHNDLLLWREKIGEIEDLRRQVRFSLMINDTIIAHYVADFVYYDIAKRGYYVDEVKRYKTKDYILKRKLFAVLYPKYKFNEV